jgi:hypothetical protein
VGQYYVVLHSLLQQRAQLPPYLCRCRHCRIFFLTHPRNARRVGDDPAVRSLPEHFGESHDWYDTAFDQVLKHCARSHGRKLVYVADQNQTGAALGTARTSECNGGTSTIEVSSTTRRPQASVFDSFLLNRPVAGQSHRRSSAGRTLETARRTNKPAIEAAMETRKLRAPNIGHFL